MQSRTLNIVLISVGAVALLVIAVSAFVLLSNQQSNSTNTARIKDNVVAYTNNPEEDQVVIREVNGDEILVNPDSHIEEGFVICAGVTEETPTGLLRKVDAVRETSDGVVLETSQAALTDAIEECHVHVYVEYTDSENYEVYDANSLDDSNGFIRDAFALEGSFKYILVDEANDLYRVKCGDYLEFELDIKDEQAYIKLVNSIELEGVINSTQSLSSSTPALKGSLRPITISIAGVPVVITNDLKVTLSSTVKCSAVDVDCGTSFHRNVGFEYTSGSAEGLVAIDEEDFVEPHFSINPEKELFSASFAPALTATLESRLYGLLGPDFSISLKGDVSVDVKKVESGISTDVGFTLPGLDWQLEGSAKGTIAVPLSAKFVLDPKLPHNIIDGLPIEASLRHEVFDFKTMAYETVLFDEKFANTTAQPQDNDGDSGQQANQKSQGNEDKVTQKANYHIVTDDFEFDIPKEWQGKVDWKVEKLPQGYSSVTVFKSGNEELVLCGVSRIDPEDADGWGDVGAHQVDCIKSKGKYVEMWTRSYCLHVFYTGEKKYSDDVLREMIPLATGGKVTFDELKKMSKSEFDDSAYEDAFQKSAVFNSIKVR